MTDGVLFDGQSAKEYPVELRPEQDGVVLEPRTDDGVLPECPAYWKYDEIRIVAKGGQSGTTYSLTSAPDARLTVTSKTLAAAISGRCGRTTQWVRHGRIGTF